MAPLGRRSGGVLSYNVLGFALISALALVAAALLSRRPDFPFPQRLFVGAVLLRIVGSTLRYEVLQRYYDGIGDASGYYATGLILARQIWQFDFDLLTPDHWLGGPRSWWGTSALWNLSGLILSVIGPTMRGEFLVFALLGFTGLVLMALAVHRLAGRQAAIAFATLTWLWPSLWFWPSSIGKEAVILLAFGLTILGFAGRGSRMHWVPFGCGLALAFAIRPHVALALAAASAIALWIGSWRRVTPSRLLQALVICVLLLVTFRAVSSEFALIDVDLEGVQEFVAYRAQQTLVGGSSLGAVPSGIRALPGAFINIWLRPFPWDVHNAMALLSAIEVLMLWFFIWNGRRSVVLAVRHWRHHRLLQLAVPLLAGYTLMIGVTFGNLGIIARQRTPLFPLVFLILIAAPLLASLRDRSPAPPRAGRVATPLPTPVQSTSRRSPWPPPPA